MDARSLRLTDPTEPILDESNRPKVLRRNQQAKRNKAKQRNSETVKKVKNMMISPEAFIEEHRDESYEELLKLRNEMFNDMRDYEMKARNGGVEVLMYPTPETMYRMDLEYFAKLCELIVEKYDQEHEWDEDDE